MRSLAMELIDYQPGDMFPKLLAEVIENIYADIDKGVYKNNYDLLTSSEYAKKIEKLVKTRFNMNVTIDKELSAYVMAAIIPFTSDYLAGANDVKGFSSSFFGELFGTTNVFKHIKKLSEVKENYYKSVHNRTGYVDTKHARVGGYLGDVRHFLILNFYSLKKLEFTVGEAVSVICHELGHAFVGLETHYKMMTNNSSIMDVLNDLNNNKPDRAYYTFKRHFGPEELEAAGLNKDSGVTDYYGPMAKKYLGNLESQFISNKYDETNYENLSDSFAVRMGVGKDLASGLKKIYSTNPEHNLPSSGAGFFFLYVTEILLFGLAIALTGLCGVIIFGLIFALFAGSDKGTMTYDMPVDRYVRIRNGIVRILKNQRLPKEYAVDLIDQFLFIDDIISKSNNMKGLMDILADYIKPSSREVFHYVKVQQTVENSLDNVLFLKTAQLRYI